jgi:hypothetical protein
MEFEMKDLLEDLRGLSRGDIIINAIATVAFCAVWPVLTIMFMAAM